MKRAALTVLCTAILGMAMSAEDAVVRPKILGILAVNVYVADVAESRAFYRSLLGAGRVCDGCERPESLEFDFPTGQIVTVEPRPRDSRANPIHRITFRVDDLKALARYFKSSRVRFSELKTGPAKSGLLVVDPEGHEVAFVESPDAGTAGQANRALAGMKLIHAGWVVRDRAGMDRFYKDVLGFHLYWQGGMKDEEVSWVSMQVPDGTDWIEYMLHIPADASKQLLGVMNHIAIGVPRVAEAAERLEAGGVKIAEQPKIGRDGKWQLNLYDPDLTRVEFMEFAPVEKPCCSEFTGTHPQP